MASNMCEVSPKAISDAGVDSYAVTAAISLGNGMPIHDRLDELVLGIMDERRANYTSSLATGLSIGWDHSDLALELVGTRDGRSAMMIIAALATGVPYYVAAQGLAELMTLSGDQSHQLPSIDALKALVAYIAPIMVGNAFSDTFDHIASSGRRPQFRLLDCSSFRGLMATGEAFVWAGSVKQLCVTAASHKKLYLIVKQRGAWLATYASYLVS